MESIDLPQPPPETKANQLTTYFSELLLKISQDKKHPLHPTLIKFENRLFDLITTLDAQLEHRRLPPIDLAQAAIVNQWLALAFLESFSSETSPTHQLLSFLLALANLEHFQESTAATNLRRLTSGAYAHARLLHTLQQLQNQQPDRYTIYVPEQPPEELDIYQLSEEEVSRLEIVKWERAGIDLVFYDAKTKTLYLIDAKGRQALPSPTTNPRRLMEPARRVAQSIISKANLPPNTTIKHLEISLPIPSLRQPHLTSNPLPPEQQTAIINGMLK